MHKMHAAAWRAASGGSLLVCWSIPPPDLWSVCCLVGCSLLALGLAAIEALISKAVWTLQVDRNRHPCVHVVMLQGQPKAAPPEAAEEPADLGHDAAPAPVAPSCVLNTEALSTVMPVTEMWANLKEAATAVWQGQRIDPSKARLAG